METASEKRNVPRHILFLSRHISPAAALHDSPLMVQGCMRRRLKIISAIFIPAFFRHVLENLLSANNGKQFLFL